VCFAFSEISLTFYGKNHRHSGLVSDPIQFRINPDNLLELHDESLKCKKISPIFSRSIAALW
jgi:hypothetical protein